MGNALTHGSSDSKMIRLFIRILGTVFEDPGELDVIKLAVADGSFFVHVVDFVMGKTVPQSRQNLTKVVLMQHASIGFVEASKCVLYHVFRIRALQPLAKQGEEHREIDGTRRLV